MRAALLLRGRVMPAAGLHNDISLAIGTNGNQVSVSTNQSGTFFPDRKVPAAGNKTARRIRWLMLLSASKALCNSAVQHNHTNLSRSRPSLDTSRTSVSHVTP